MPVLKADISGKRLRELAEAGLQVFCRQGFERSQMADVAKAMKVAVGTVYLYVGSKEALFDLVIRYGSSADASWLDQLEIPVATPAPGATMAYLKKVFDETEWPCLAAALEKKRAKDPAAELAGVLSEQYALIRQHRRGLLLLTRSAMEFPGLAEVFVMGLRNKLLEQLVHYIRLRAAAGQFRSPADPASTAALMIQSITWANLQRPLDPGLAALDEASFEHSTIEFLVHGLLP
ncbi:TetR/AcrR family transcriptional regulator [Haloferula sp. BvORR071]|uniref:TetR/AcrR family transcriptional regulator n=1 Tax=Haloferula sp. BvORR071 TaxID=1396141 RepID=UPI00055934E4|nr:TetR/AcrR family transcriptional regulator [Haloferula sp. BvORR071]